MRLCALSKGVGVRVGKGRAAVGMDAGLPCKWPVVLCVWGGAAREPAEPTPSPMLFSLPLPCVCLLLLCPVCQFVHVLFCLQLYLLSPFVRRYIRTASMTAHVTLTCIMALVALLLLWPLSGVLSGLFLLAALSISFVCPYWLVHIHKFKSKINGPWDEAVPKVPTSIHAGTGDCRG